MVSSSGAHDPIGRAGVLGAGQMGAGIAGILVRAGIPTTLVDVNPAIIATAADRVRRIAGHAREGAGDTTGHDGPGPLLTLSSELSAFLHEDVLIEAVIEDEPTKTAAFRSLSEQVPESAILASNTSTIPISRMARAVSHPARFAGLHFFHPVHRMELVEVIRGEQTGEQTLARLVALGRRLGKTPIVVRDGPGFFTTRVLSAYLDQALQLLEQGTPTEEIDAAATSFGMPMGPIALLDLVGLDTALAISRVMAGAIPDRFRVSPLLESLVQAGRLGRKSGHGFRSYGARGESSGREPSLDPPGRPASQGAPPPTPQEVTDRLFLPMLLESFRTLEEGIVASPRDADLGVVLGLGFPASRGGILAWCDAEGPAAILERVEALSSLGPAFQPPGLLVQMARDGSTFQPRPDVREQAGHGNDANFG